MPRSRRTKVRNMPPSQRKAVMANMSAKHRRWARMSHSQRRKAGYLERYPRKVEEAKWFTAGGRRVGRMFLDDEEIRVARDELKSDEYLDVIDPDDGETIVGPAWYKDAAAGDLQAINKILRHKKTTDDEKVKQVHDEFGLSEHLIHELMTPDWGKPGYESWQLSNNNANIKRMEVRIKEMEVREATPTTEVTFADGTIIDNREDDRVQIDFDEKPDDAMISKLRGSGWRWAPSLRVWQRKRTNAAMYSAKQITGAS